MNKPLPIVLIGGGGHASVLADILIDQKREILALISPDDISSRLVFSGIPHFQNDSEIEKFNKNDVILVNGIGALPGSDTRRNVHETFKALGYSFMTVISPKAKVSKFAILAEGVQVLAGCIVNTHAIIGDGTILNSGTVIEHDCFIGKFNHIAPGAVLCGSVTTGDCVHISTGARIIQGVNIGANTLIGAGATATKNIGSNHALYVAKPHLLERKQ